MSTLSDMFGAASIGGQDLGALSADSLRRQQEYYAYLKANYPAQYEQEKANDPAYQREQADQAAAARYQAELAAAQGANMAPESMAPPSSTYAGPTATEELDALLPVGFDTSRLPSSFGDPFIESRFGKARGSAQDLIDTMLKRGTVTESGRAAGVSALGQQDPGVRGKLRNLSDLMLEQERGGLRGIANQGRAAASGQTGEFFDPAPYKSAVDTELARFQGAFPGAFESASGSIGYDTSGFGGATGAATSPRNTQFDPYAVEGGKLTGATGLDEEKQAPVKKRSTAVF
jgi:hypothetical protein